MIWDVIIGGVFKTLDKIIPDPIERAEAKRRLLEMEQAQELAFLKADTDLAIEQIKVNLAEAQSTDPFTSRWRPGVGWVCVMGMTYQFLAQPLLAWGSAIWGYPAPPVLAFGDLMTILISMLGLGAYRTTEKIKGVAK